MNVYSATITLLDGLELDAQFEHAQPAEQVYAEVAASFGDTSTLRFGGLIVPWRSIRSVEIKLLGMR